MINEQLIRRINELARKKKSEGLTEAEQAEQAELRQQYIQSFRASFRQQLERIEFVEDHK